MWNTSIMTCNSKLQWLRGDRFLLLLVSLVVTLLLAPLMEEMVLGKLLMHGCFTLVFLTGVLANRRRKGIFITAIILAAFGIPLGWLRLLSDSTGLSLTRLIVDMIFFSFTAVMILVAVVKDHMASKQAILGAISVYLLMGLTWALGYSAIEMIEEEPFRFIERQVAVHPDADSEITAWSQMVYYSFVTMSTLGYGDITPRTPLAQTVTWMQAVAGQLYLVVLIARMVSELPRSHDRQR